MAQNTELFFALRPPDLESMNHKLLLRHLSKATSAFGYWAQFHYGIHLNYRLETEEYEQWIAPGLRMVDEMDWVITEVFNGGFLQYFTNSGGDHALLAIEGWRKSGCEPVAAAIETAVRAAFPDGKVPDRKARINLIDGDEPRWKREFEPSDKRLYAIVKELGEMLSERTAAYVRNHPTEFFRPSVELPERFAWLRGKGV